MPLPASPFNEETFRPIVEALGTKDQKPLLVGPHGSSLALALTLLIHTTPGTAPPPASSKKRRAPVFPSRSWLILTPTGEDAERLYQDLQFFHTLLEMPAESLTFFPQRGHSPYEAAPPPIDLVAQRMRTLFRLTQGKPTVVITSVSEAIQRLLPFSVLSEACLKLTVGAVIEREALVARLLRLGYRRVSVVEIPGEFSVRGGIVDIFSTAYSEPLRVEFLGDSLESTRMFDPATQESTTRLAQAWVLPAREFLPPGNDSSSARADLPPDAEWQNPEVYPKMDLLADYFLDSPVVVMDRPLSLDQQAREFWQRILEAWERMEDAEGRGNSSEPERQYARWEEVVDSLQDHSILGIDPFSSSDQSWHPVVHYPIQAPSSLGLGLRGTSFTDTLGTLETLRSQGPVLVVAGNQGQAGRLLALFSEHDSPAVEWNPREWRIAFPQRPPFYIAPGHLSTGFVCQEGPSFAIVTAEELFAKVSRPRPQPKSKAATFLSNLDDLNVGDYVVHIQHGISCYQGLRRLSVQGFESDYLVLKFASHDTLYVPLDRLNQVQRYRGGDNHAPKLDRLGGTSWAKTTARVKKGIEDMAQELVELYASREVVKRKIYGEDTTLTHEFEAAFEYEETPDQIRAIQEIQRDLENTKPMDRLVCGDVGYGKTEVAMRAAFKAVQDNRQVVVLVPTTLLAQQHSETFSRRFASFPIRIATLSRFQRPKEVKALLPDLASGVIDIVIGTHRLLQKDVQFKDLGLVIVDEEQWFGVRHKERLKQLRTQVDVLTLTATPIPRTLQMAFSGVRDLSIIDTPPPGRLAILTKVLRFDPQVIHEAIRREMARGGQTFFVHNRVQTMERMATWIKELVPEAKVVMAHGQMDERVLEGVMLKFIRGETDVLVASAIIQSGLDLPRANTILIDRADTFGLAQLYQLRGRVGRAGDQAYAYFFFPNEEVLSTDAQKRLMAIQDFTDLGSGFRIAAADLEIRGAGNLLGKQQSGNIAAVGLDLYMKMMEQTVQKMKGVELEEELDPTLHLNVSAYIPEDYVEDVHQRLSLYKRLSASQQIGDLALLHGETQDRFGSLPEAVERLFEVMQIKVQAKLLGLESVEAKNKVIALAFDRRASISEAGLGWLMDYGKERIRFLSPRSFKLQTDHQDWPLLLEELSYILQELSRFSVRPVAPTLSQDGKEVECLTGRG